MSTAMSASTTSSNTRSAKALSLNLSNGGPKPLHLLHSNLNSSDTSVSGLSLGSPGVSSSYSDSPTNNAHNGPPSAPLSTTKSFRPARTDQTRRQSSISYISS